MNTPLLDGIPKGAGAARMLRVMGSKKAPFNDMVSAWAKWARRAARYGGAGGAQREFTYNSIKPYLKTVGSNTMGMKNQPLMKNREFANAVASSMGL